VLPAPAPDDWTAVLERQCGVITRAQALASGLSPGAWRHRTSTCWQLPVPGVAVAHTGPLTDVQLRWCAVLAAGTGAALSADWALVAQGFQTRDPGPLQLAVPEQRQVSPPALAGIEVQVHRVRDLRELVHPLHAPPVVRTAPAALHAAAWAPSDRAGEWRVAAVVQQRLTTVRALRSALEEMPRLPRRALLRLVLDDVELRAHAQTELDLLRLLRSLRLPLPDRMQLRERGRTGRRYLDAWWERQRVVLEVDGAHHRDAVEWDADLLRANAIGVAHRADRVLLLRLTGSQLRAPGPDLVEQLRAALAG
jgi:very-short-patch-repair endonuclease